MIVVAGLLALLASILLLSNDSSQTASANYSWGTPIYPASNWNGVDVFSNGDSYFSPDPPGLYGYQYQCVELVQRFYAQKLGYANNKWNSDAWQVFYAGHHPDDIISISNGGSPGASMGGRNSLQ